MQSHFDLLTSRRKSVGQFTTKVPDKTQKGAATLVAAPLLEIGNVIPRRLGHRARIMIHAPLRTFDFATELENLYHAVKS